MYIMFVKYDDSVCERFSKVYDYIETLPYLYTFKEKIKIEWVLLDDVLYKKVNLRNVFQTTVENNINNILKVAYNYTSTNSRYRYGRRSI
jgi:hypothetical protein